MINVELIECLGYDLFSTIDVTNMWNVLQNIGFAISVEWFKWISSIKSCFSLTEIDLLQPSRRKWIHCFSHINAIIFISNCRSFDGIIQSLDQFYGLINKYKWENSFSFSWSSSGDFSYHLNDKPVILLLNHFDLLSNVNHREEELTSLIKFLSIFEKSSVTISSCKTIILYLF